MILIVLVIYFIVLIIIEFITIVFSNFKKKQYIKTTNILNSQNLKDEYNLNLQLSEKDLDIKNYIGKFYLKKEYGFFINLDNWNLLESGILYDFDIPINIKVIKIESEPNIEYFIEKINKINN
jgi:hypothetical protein